MSGADKLGSSRLVNDFHRLPPKRHLTRIAKADQGLDLIGRETTLKDLLECVARCACRPVCPTYYAFTRERQREAAQRPTDGARRVQRDVGRRLPGRRRIPR
jgi:hypothetical protein